MCMEESTDQTNNSVGGDKLNLKPWLYKKGQSGNPSGRPKGTKSLKTYAKEMLERLTDEEREEYLDSLPKDFIWKMAEGNPQTDITSAGERLIPKPILPLNKDALPTNNSNEQDTSVS